jgi:Protein of unknown function DUF2620
MSVRIGVIGIASSEVSSSLRAAGDIEPLVAVDMEAASSLAAGELDYLIGVCESGGGAALAIPIAILGSARCSNVSKLGRPADAEEIIGLLDGGTVAFGVARDHLGELVPRLASAILKRHAALPPGT